MKHAALLPPLTALYFFLAGCGTSHHFLPPRPLEKGETMISLAWHYDLSGLHTVDPLPDANFYFGAGKDYNIGFGMKIPIVSVNHVTTAKYFSENNGNYSSAFFHVNQLLGPNNNPYLEVGGAYFKWDESFNQSFLLGLGFGTGVVDPLIDVRFGTPNKEKFKRHLKIMPFAKYAAAGSEFGVSLNYYYGINKSAAEHLIETFYKDNDTILAIKGDLIDSVSQQGVWAENHVLTDYIYLNTGDTVQLRRYYMICGTGMFMGLWFLPWMEPSWYTAAGKLRSNELDYQLYSKDLGSEIEVMVDIEKLRERAARGEDIVFWRFSEDLNRRLLKRKKTLKLWHDLSFGVAVISYEKSDD